MSRDPRNDREEVRLLLNKINDAWLKGRLDDLSDVLNECFAEDIVVRGAGFQDMARGKEECVRSYGDFIRLLSRRGKLARRMARDAAEAAVEGLDPLPRPPAH
jgi:hypothetical protein